MSTDVRFWDGIAEKYARQPLANPDAFERKIAITRSNLTATDVVLDIGCGTGSLALRLAPYAAHVHGLDISSEMIRIAREKAAAQRIENVTFHVGRFDDEFRAFDASSLDCVCAYSLLHLVPARQATLAQIHRLLKPGGVFVSSTTCLRESWVPYGPILRVMKAIGKAPDVWLLSKRELAGEISRAGFVELVQPDVGAKADIAFVVARKLS